MLPITLFVCNRCNTSKKIESKGEVIGGPVCGSCGKAMRRVTPVQSELKLFPGHKASGSQRNSN